MPHLYATPLSGPRPFGSFRLDVYSRTAGRRLTLFGASALHLFVDLELDNAVSHLCERPLVIPDSKPQRLVDFWALRDGVPHFYLSLRKGEAEGAFAERAAIQDFAGWVHGQHGQLHMICFSNSDRGKFRTSNYSYIAQHLSLFAPNKEASIATGIFAKLPPLFSLGDAELIIDPEDPVRGRTHVFLGWMNGDLSCSQMDNLPLTSQSQFEKTNAR